MNRSKNSSTQIEILSCFTCFQKTYLKWSNCTQFYEVYKIMVLKSDKDIGNYNTSQSYNCKYKCLK